MPSNGQNRPATDSASTLRGVVGDDSTAEFENDPAFVESNPTGNASSENLHAAGDVDVEEDDETEEDDLEDGDEDFEDDDELEDEVDEDDEIDDNDDDLDDEDDPDDEDDEDDAEEVAAAPAVSAVKQKRPAGSATFRPMEQKRSQGSRYVMSTVRF